MDSRRRADAKTAEHAEHDAGSRKRKCVQFSATYPEEQQEEEGEIPMERLRGLYARAGAEWSEAEKARVEVRQV